MMAMVCVIVMIQIVINNKRYNMKAIETKTKAIDKLIIKIGKCILSGIVDENIFIDFRRLINILTLEAKKINYKEVVFNLTSLSQKIEENKVSQMKSIYVTCQCVFPILIEEYIKVIDKKELIY